MWVALSFKVRHVSGPNAIESGQPLCESLIEALVIHWLIAATMIWVMLRIANWMVPVRWHSADFSTHRLAFPVSMLARPLAAVILRPNLLTALALSYES